ncbi:MAG: biotin/lipoyl-binding protein, partial [Pseudomonadota bacterium]|nr:biotin/lipoyl-binding protein [Pseudomonadota bacterium]
MDTVDSNRSREPGEIAEERQSSEPVRSDIGSRSKPIETKAPSTDTGGEPTDQDGGNKKGSKLPLVILAIVVVFGAIAGGAWWFLHRNQVNTDDAYTDGRVVMVASQVNGYVTVLAVNDNQFVHKGDLLLQIDPRPLEAERDQAKGDLASAQAELANAQLSLEKSKTMFPAQLAQAEGQLTQAQGSLNNSQADYKRQHAVERGATTQQNVDQSTATLRNAQGQVQVAQAQVDIAKLIPQNIEQAAAQVKQIEGQVMQAQAKLATAEVNL